MGNDGKNKPIGAIRLKEALTESGISQKDFAIKTHASAQSVSFHINGHRNMSPETATVYAAVLGVRPQWLLGLDNVKRPFEMTLREKIDLDKLTTAFYKSGYYLSMDAPEDPADVTDAAFTVHAISSEDWHKCSYSELLRLWDMIQQTQNALIGSFIRTSCEMSPEDIKAFKRSGAVGALEHFDRVKPLIGSAEGSDLAVTYDKIKRGSEATAAILDLLAEDPADR